jgi:NADPH-dependent curcumin reductase CurA
VRNTWLSIDPSVRMRLDATGLPGYHSPLQIGDALSGLAIGEVVESRAAGFAAGDVVSHTMGYRDLAIVPSLGGTIGGMGALTRVETHGRPIQTYLGALGSSGLTAWAGLVHAAGLKDGDVVWVSAAAGAVGSLAAQIAKLRGHVVIGSAGSAAKIDHLLNNLHLDAAIDYTTDDLDTALASAAPNGIDVYFDNVGGSHLQSALYALRTGGRVALCGAISGYESSATVGPDNLFQAVAKSLRLTGFRAGDYIDEIEQMREEVGRLLDNDQLVVQETIFDGLGSAADALVSMLRGQTTGKTLCRV